MRISTFLLWFMLLLTAPSSPAQAPKGVPPKKTDDLPEVTLVIPEETRPEVKALIKAHVNSLKSSKASERVMAAQVLGELKDQGKPVRGLLCRAMLDTASSVRVAAADALKNIDPKMQHLAVSFVLERETYKHHLLLNQIQKLEEDGEPLAILVANSALQSAMTKGREDSLAMELTTLSYIARNDYNACRLIASALGNPNQYVRFEALNALPRMKHGRQYVEKIIQLLRTDTPRNRVACVQTLTALADDTNEEKVAAAVTSQRYHPEETVRQAVEMALTKLENRKKP